MVEITFVLAVMAKIPSECSLYAGRKEDYCQPGTVGHYDRSKDTRAIAEAIAKVAIDERDAIEQSVYAAYEGQLKLNALGDGGRSHGPWQTPFLRVTAEGYLADWLAIRQRSITNCANNSPETKLAQLASGYCTQGTRVVAKRHKLVEDMIVMMTKENTQ